MPSSPNTSNKLLTMIKNGVAVGGERDKFDIYRRNCYSFTNFNLNRFGKNKFGNDWIEKRGINKSHIDHIISIKEGYEMSIEPELIGSICNLQLINGSMNIRKGSDSWMEVSELRKNFQLLLDNDMEYDLLLLEKIEKNNKYFYDEN